MMKAMARMDQIAATTTVIATARGHVVWAVMVGVVSTAAEPLGLAHKPA